MTDNIQKEAQEYIDKEFPIDFSECKTEEEKEFAITMLGNWRLSANLAYLAGRKKTLENEAYWKKRCEAAEAYIEKCPCDHDEYPEQIEAHVAWLKSKQDNGL